MRNASATVLVVAILMIAGAFLSGFSRANPYYYAGEVAPKPDTVPPKVSFFSPMNGAVFNTSFVILTFDLTGPTGPTVYYSDYTPYLQEVCYKADWLPNNVTIYAIRKGATFPYEIVGKYSANLTLTDVPEGKHNITVFAKYHGTYIPGNNPNTQSQNGFTITGSSSVNFTVDNEISPNIYAVTVENKTFNSTNIPLTFRVNEPIAKITYTLDGQTKTVVTLNTILTGLSYGTHNLTAYPTDPAGNDGMLKAVKFTVVDVFAPKISILSIEQNKVYNSSTLALNFSVNEPSYKLSYVLDEQANVTFSGNSTLTGLSNGNHNVTLYGMDNAGNIGVSETTYFTIQVSEPFTTVTLAGTSVIAAVIAVLLVYCKKRIRGQNR